MILIGWSSIAGLIFLSGLGYENTSQAHITARFCRSRERPLKPGNRNKWAPSASIEPNFVSKASSWGIDSRKQVVVYDSSGGAYAARLWWMLRYYSHPRVAVLDGGFTKWLAEGRPTRAGVERPIASSFEGYPDPSQEIDTGEVDRIRQNP